MWCSCYSRLVSLRERGPIVTFTFDDFPRTAMTNGARVLEQFGARATYYVAMGLMNTTNRLGQQFRKEDLHFLVERGHEIASHTFSHSSAREVPHNTFRRDVEDGEKAIAQILDDSVGGNFAYPYGAVTLTTKRTLGPKMLSCRGTCPGLNGPEVDLNLLRANCLYGDVDQADGAKQLVLENERRRSWLIFYSHDVTPNPSRFGCTPALLESVASFVANRGSKMLTVSEVMAEIGQRSKQEDHPQVSSAAVKPVSFALSAKRQAGALMNLSSPMIQRSPIVRRPEELGNAKFGVDSRFRILDPSG